MLQVSHSEKACRICGKPFLPRRPLQAVCGLRCAKRVPVLERKAEKTQDRAKREAMRPLSYWVKQAQIQVNRYARARDYFLGCVSCDLGPNWQGQWHASHLRSTGAAPGLRFHLWNIHKADSVCNNHKSGNLAEYEPRLRVRIGDEKVDWLRTQNKPVKFTREYLQRLARVFRKKAKRQEDRNAMLG